MVSALDKVCRFRELWITTNSILSVFAMWPVLYPMQSGHTNLPSLAFTSPWVNVMNLSFQRCPDPLLIIAFKVFLNSLLATLNSREALKESLAGISEIVLSDLQNPETVYTTHLR